MSPDEVTTATTEPEKSAPQANTRRLLSGDGAWWWNGRRWVPATTEDALWKWDGARWQPTKNLEGRRPEDLAATLAVLAEDRPELVPLRPWALNGAGVLACFQGDFASAGTRFAESIAQ